MILWFSEGGCINQLVDTLNWGYKIVFAVLWRALLPGLTTAHAAPKKILHIEFQFPSEIILPNKLIYFILLFLKNLWILWIFLACLCFGTGTIPENSQVSNVTPLQGRWKAEKIWAQPRTISQRNYNFRWYFNKWRRLRIFSTFLDISVCHFLMTWVIMTLYIFLSVVSLINTCFFTTPVWQFGLHFLSWGTLFFLYLYFCFIHIRTNIFIFILIITAIVSFDLLLVFVDLARGLKHRFVN